MTLRLRLTLLYGACFVVAGGALLGITYLFVAQDTTTQPGKFAIHGAELQLPGPASFPAPGTAPRGTFHIVTGGPSSSVSPVVIDRIKQTGQRQFAALADRANAALITERTNSLNSLLTFSAIALVIVGLLSILIGWLVAGRSLRPLRIMSRRARAITEENLHERLGIEAREDELGELAQAFDALLGRLERAFDAQRRFVANASHELRTPLTLERAVVEVALADPAASLDTLRRACERVLATNAQQERLIDALLALARGQAGSERAEPVDLAAVAGAAVADRGPDPGGIAVRTALAPALVRGDEALLERLVANLIDNAIAYNELAHGWVELRTGTRAGRAVLTVSNPGPVIAPERVTSLFEPFRRLEGDRLGGGDGVGLGLSIVRAIAEAAGGTVSARARPDGGLEVEVELPVRDAEPVPGHVGATAELPAVAGARVEAGTPQ